MTVKKCFLRLFNIVMSVYIYVTKLMHVPYTEYTGSDVSNIYKLMLHQCNIYQQFLPLHKIYIFLTLSYF